MHALLGPRRNAQKRQSGTERGRREGVSCSVRAKKGVGGERCRKEEEEREEEGGSSQDKLEWGWGGGGGGAPFSPLPLP